MVGDLGNLQTDRFGQVNIKKDDLVASITGNNAADIIGRSLVVSFIELRSQTLLKSCRITKDTPPHTHVYIESIIDLCRSNY